jgi:hypothetical protein
MDYACLTFVYPDAWILEYIVKDGDMDTEILIINIKNLGLARRCVRPFLSIPVEPMLHQHGFKYEEGQFEIRTRTGIIEVNTDLGKIHDMEIIEGNWIIEGDQHPIEDAIITWKRDIF